MGSEESLTVSRLSPTGLLGRLKALMTDGSDRSIAQRLAGAAFLVRVASAALAFISQVLLARWMGGFEFGVYVYAWTWVLLIGGMCDFGLATSAQRFIPEYAEGKKLPLLRGFLSESDHDPAAAAEEAAGSWSLSHSSPPQSAR